MAMSGNGATISARRRTCMLILTHDCNLNCTYCYEAFKSKRRMPIPLAKELVSKEFSFVASSPDFDELEIDFMGGEPLLRFDLIQEIVEWTINSDFGAPYVFFANTNGTLLDERKKTWFRAHRDRVCLGLSLDGSPEMQRTNRGRASTALDLSFFKENWPKQQVKMTISKESLKTLAEEIIHVHRTGLLVEPTLAHGPAWTDEDAQELGRQLDLLGEYYLVNPDVRPVELLSKNLSSVLHADSTPKKYCGTGTHMVTYDVDGQAFPCHMFTPLVLGERASAQLRQADFQDDAALLDPACMACELRQVCPTCYGMNLKKRGDVASREKARCQLVRTIVNAACAFQLQTLATEAAELDESSAVQMKALLQVHALLENSRSA